MSRTFPHYTRLDLDPEVFPPNYWAASNKCPTCELHWPTSHLFSTTPCCGDEAEKDEHNAPDMRWPDAIKSLLSKRFEDLYDQYNDGITDEQLAWEDVKKTKQRDFEPADAKVVAVEVEALK